MRNVGRVLTRPMIAEHVWGLDFDPESNIVDVYVGYVRRKIDGPGEPRLLHTVRGGAGPGHAASLQAVGGEIGHVDDFVVADESWSLRDVVVNTRNWWQGKKVLISPEWIAWVSWMEFAVHVDLHRDAIRQAPVYDPSRPMCWAFTRMTSTWPSRMLNTGFQKTPVLSIAT